MLNPKQKGNLVELQCISAFYELGYQVSIPYGENSRYDFVVDINNILYKVQVKASHPKKDQNAIEFSCQSHKSKKNGNTQRKYTPIEIDFFATFYNGNCYLIPINECSRTKVLRFDKCMNNQKTNINFAEDYLLSKQLEKLP